VYIYNESSGRRAILKLLIKSPPAAAAAQRIKTNEREMYGLMEKYIIHTPPESRAYQYLKR
jgi:hypothetical protein